MAVGYGTITANTSTFNGTGTDSFSHTHASGAGLLAIVVGGDRNAAASISATYNSVSMTKVYGEIFQDSAPGYNIAAFYLAGAATGANTLELTLGGGGCKGLCVWAIDTTNEDTTDPIGASNHTFADWSSTQSTSLTPQNNDARLFYVAIHRNDKITGFTLNSPLVELSEIEVNEALLPAGPAAVLGTYVRPTIGSQTLSSSATGAGYCGAFAIELNEAAPSTSSEAFGYLM